MPQRPCRTRISICPKYFKSIVRLLDVTHELFLDLFILICQKLSQYLWSMSITRSDIFRGHLRPISWWRSSNHLMNLSWGTSDMVRGSMNWWNVRSPLMVLLVRNLMDNLIARHTYFIRNKCLVFVISFLSNLKMKFFSTVKALCHSNPVWMVAFVAFLFESLGLIHTLYFIF
jgi:hypothetical protein